MRTNWKKANKTDVEDEFDRLVDCIRTQGDLDCIIELVPLNKKRDFIIGWHDNDEVEE